MSNPGECGAELIALIESELAALDVTGRRIVLGKLDRFWADHPDTPFRSIPEPLSRPAFTDAEARQFNNALLPGVFKAHAHQPVGEVPVSYLCYLTDPDPFVTMVKQYLASDYGKQRIANEAD